MTIIHHHNNHLHPSPPFLVSFPHQAMLNPRIQDHGDDDGDKRLGQSDGCISSSRNGGDHQELLQFRAGHDEDNLGGDDSGFCSPPLWKNSHSPSTSQPLLSHHVHISLSLSPKSRLQAITRGQRELMEMVRNLPESSYELSLKDLVEHHKMEMVEVQTQAEAPVAKRLDGSKQRGAAKAIRRQESKRSVGRSGSFEIENRGLFLKMGFPFSLNKSKKKNSSSSSSRGSASNGKVSPKPEGMKNGGGGSERDWWKKKFTGSRDSDSSRTSNNSGSSGSRSSSSASSTVIGRCGVKISEYDWYLMQEKEWAHQGWLLAIDPIQQKQTCTVEENPCCLWEARTCENTC